MVLQSVDLYVSSESIEKGARWGIDLARELESTHFGIICVTPSNLDAPWIHFEAGALSKSIDSSNVSPFLFLVERRDINGPLSQFQSTEFDKEDFRKLIRTINSKNDETRRVTNDFLDKTYNTFWPKLKERLNKIISRSELAYHGLRFNHEHIEKSSILLEHRATHGDLLTKALSSENHLLLLSIMPQNIARDIEGMVSKGIFKAKSLRVMMLRNDLPKDMLTALGEHLNETNDKSKQVSESWKHWKILKKKNNNITLRGYSSVPMYQITMVLDSWMTVEIIPFGVGTQKRPALFLTKEDNPKLFEQFSDAAEFIWNNAGEKIV